MEKRRLVGLDGLRGVAALCIVLLHTTLVVPFTVLEGHAYLAVDFFFMLSGFVIGYAYDGKLLGGMSFRRFVLVRVVRLSPMLTAGVVLGGVQRLFFPFDTGAVALPALIASAVFALLFLPTPRLHLSTPDHPASAFPINGSLWSLFFEMVSNVLYAPMVRWLTIPRLRATALVTAVGLTVSVFHLGSLSFGFSWDYTLLLGLFRVLCPFTIGVLIFRSIDLTHAPFGGWALVGLAIAIVASLLVPVHDGRYYDLLVTLLVFPAIVIVAAKVRDEGRFHGIWTWLGAVSYPVYALHWPLLNIYAHVIGGRTRPDTGLLPSALGGFALSLALSWLASVAIDGPVRAAINARLHRRRTASSVPGEGGELHGPSADRE